MGEQHSDQTPTEKPEPNEEDKAKAAEMMAATKQDRPTLILPGTGGAVSGTAVGEWLDDDGNAKYGNEEDGPAAKANGDESANKEFEEQAVKDKAFNEAVIKDARERAGTKEG